jgi:ectoine hydroxylase-related dioxygenase (phytanoyl-CoA dioxygenase family)
MTDQADNLLPFPVANHLLAQPALLRREFANDGFLFFKQIIPRQTLLDLREEFAKILAEEGVTVAGDETNDARAIARPFREGNEEYFRVHDRLVKLESFHALAHDANLLSLMRSVLGVSAFPHPLSIARLVFPNHSPATTPPHQDFPNNQGSEKLSAAWIPLGDCPLTMGPVKVLRGSHKYGVLSLRYHLGPGNRTAHIPEEMSELQWYGSPFEVGDVLVFSALTVHAAMDNLEPSRMRLSVDFRYQTEGQPLTATCLEPHFGRLTWDQIYEGWASDLLKYYWRKKKYEVVEWDNSMNQLSTEDAAEGMRMALEYAAHRGEIEIKLKH